MLYSFKYYVAVLVHCILTENITYCTDVSFSNNDVSRTDISFPSINSLFDSLGLDPEAKKRMNNIVNVFKYPTYISMNQPGSANEKNSLVIVDSATGQNNLIGKNNESIKGIDKKPEFFVTVQASEDEKRLDEINKSLMKVLNFPEIKDGLKLNTSEQIKWLFPNNDFHNKYETSLSPLDITYTPNIISRPAVSNTRDKNNPDPEVWDPKAEVNARKMSLAQNTRRLYRRGSKKTKIEDFPFVAAVMLMGQFQCAGSIIKADLILTAASCLQLLHNNMFYRENPRVLSVRVGSSFAVGGGELIPALEVYFYPSYTPKTLRHNLAIIRLNYWIRHFNHYVKRIIFDRNRWRLPANSGNVLILGWGARTITNTKPNLFLEQLQMAQLPYYPKSACRNTYSAENVGMQVFCIGYMSLGGGACNYDVGGPAILHGILVGVISFGSPICGAVDSPTIITKIGFYADWIDSIMEQDVPVRLQQVTTTTTETPTETTTEITTTTTQLQPLRMGIKRVTPDATFYENIQFQNEGEDNLRNYEEDLKEKIDEGTKQKLNEKQRNKGMYKMLEEPGPVKIPVNNINNKKRDPGPVKLAMRNNEDMYDSIQDSKQFKLKEINKGELDLDFGRNYYDYSEPLRYDSKVDAENVNVDNNIATKPFYSVNQAKITPVNDKNNFRDIIESEDDDSTRNLEIESIPDISAAYSDNIYEYNYEY